jgi:cytochrome c peroxidase
MHALPRHLRVTLAISLATGVVGCAREIDAPTATVASARVDTTRAVIASATSVSTAQAAGTVGVPFSYDASAAALTVLRGPRLSYAVRFTSAANGLAASGSRITGIPTTVAPITATITAADLTGRTTTILLTITVRAIAAPITVASANAVQGVVVGAAFNYDATKAGTTFAGGSSALVYTVTVTPTSSGLIATNGRLAGSIAAPGIITATIVARDASGQSATNVFPIVAFAPDLTTPTLTDAFSYTDALNPLPASYRDANAPGGSAVGTDNTPATNAITNAAATLGRVLFYDRRLSVNDRVACASCHQQAVGFADTARLSVGFAGALTTRHSMSLTNARFYQRGRFFWDERAATLEDQVLQPIQNTTEMGLTLPEAVTKLQASGYYAALFQAAFGTADITSDRVSRALAQFVRAMVSTNSKYDRAFTNGPPNFPAVFNADELAGQQLFNGPAGCARCHQTAAFASDNVHNTGLDATVTDVGAGNGRFKAPSLRNSALRGRFMHDGRFASLDQVVEFYNSGVQNNPNLDPRLRGPNGQPARLNLSVAQKGQLVAFLRALTDSTLATAPKFGSPFGR